MPLAVTHVLLTVIAVDLYRDYVTKHKKYFTLHTIFVAGVAGLLPDIDIPLTWVLNVLIPGSMPAILAHGGLTHTPFFGLVFLLPAFYLWKDKEHKKAMYFFVITFGVLFHIFLDFLLGGGMREGIMVFWPLSADTFKIHILSKLGLVDVPQGLDALILLLWLYREERRHKIKDFI
ncbi:MAG: metal-dependent hydrolase [Candidatus Aenigmarchaeota archaeon]|nr:metal-dependent hydrolase [Candidatus Aenigmarchaeota archaeon]